MPKYPEHVLVKFPEGTRAAVRKAAHDIGSQEFIRRAVAAALDGGKAVPAANIPKAGKSRAHGRLSGCAHAIDKVLVKPRTVRDIAKETGLFEGRVEKELKAMEAAGLVRWVDGMVERV